MWNSRRCVFECRQQTRAEIVSQLKQFVIVVYLMEWAKWLQRVFYYQMS